MPTDAPAGQYIVEIGFYHATTGERLWVVGADGSVGDHVVLLGVEGGGSAAAQSSLRGREGREKRRS